MKNHINNFIKEARSVTLSATEKSRLKEEMMSKMSQSESLKSPYAVFLTQRLSVQYTAVLLLVFLLSGGGAVAAAEGSLPGEFLYPLKTSVNEEVVTAFTFSEKAQAERQALLAERRLKEAEKLSIQGQLSRSTRENLEKSFRIHVRSANKQVSQLEDSNIEGAIDVQSRLSSTLKAHADILDMLGEELPEEQKIVLQIQNQLVDISQKKQALEDRLFAEVSQGTTTKKQAEKLRQSSQKVLAALEKLSENTSLSSKEEGQAQQALKQTKNLIEQGQQKIRNNKYKEAALLFSRAFQVGNDTQTTLATHIEFNTERTEREQTLSKDAIAKNVAEGFALRLNTEVRHGSRNKDLGVRTMSLLKDEKSSSQKTEAPEASTTTLEKEEQNTQNHTAYEYLEAFPRLLDRDFEGVEGIQGVYVYSDEGLSFKAHARFQHSAQPNLSQKGIKRLLTNLEDRLEIEISDTASLNMLFEKIEPVDSTTDSSQPSHSQSITHKDSETGTSSTTTEIKTGTSSSASSSLETEVKNTPSL